MKKIIKTILCPIFILLSLLFFYFGGVLPFLTARRYITALYQLPNIMNIADFENVFNPVLDSYSFVGGEEIVNFITSAIVKQPERLDNTNDTMRELVNYIEPHLSQNNVKHLLNIADSYSILWRRRGGESDDFVKAENYYLKVCQIGPKLPQALYGLLNLYSMKEDKEKIREAMETILRYWPDDEKTKNMLESL